MRQRIARLWPAVARLPRQALCFILGLLLLGFMYSSGCGSRSRWSANDDREVQLAAANADNVRVMQLCERYFAGVRSKDPDPQRTSFMRELYRRAFVRWFLSSPPQDEQYATHVARYRAVMGAASGGKP